MLRRCGTPISAPPSPTPGSRTAPSRAPLTACASHWPAPARGARAVPGAAGRRRCARCGAGAGAVEATRPELLAACVALVAHPDDDRYRGLLGARARTPLFAAEVPLLAHRLADPRKGTG